MTKEKLNFRSLGEGKPLLILHGILGSSDQWLPVANKLSAYRKVIIPDMPNHALSPHFVTMDFSAIADIVADFVREQGLKDFTILGHSWGGKVAVKLVEKQLFTIEKLILADIVTKAYPLFQEHAEWIEAVENVRIEDCKSFVEVSEAIGKFVSDRRVVLLLLKNMYKKNQTLQWRSNMKGIVENFNQVLESVIPQEKITIPTLLMRGENSHYTSEEDFQEMKKSFLKLEEVILLNAGHWMHADNLEGFVERVVEFMTREMEV